MKRLVLSLALTGLAAAAVAGAAFAQEAAPKGDPVHGRKIYDSYGCYQCHGYQGQGGASSGPKLAPNPLPYEAVYRQLRRWLSGMGIELGSQKNGADGAPLVVDVEVPARADHADVGSRG